MEPDDPDTPMTGSRPLRRVLLVAAPLLVLGAGTVALVVLLSGPPPVPIRVDGRTVLVDEGTTFGQLLVEEDLHARNGRLLDVEGGVLQRRHDPGRILLNGMEPSSRSVLLVDDDRVDVIDGTDETEDLVRVTHRADSPHPLNPARTLGLVRTEETLVRGELSGILVRTRSRRIGRIEQPDAVALTFDDGPYPKHTAKILSILDRYQVPATFFVVGTWAERYPELIRREEQMGMEVANHSWSHPDDPPLTSLHDGRIRREIADTNALLRRLASETRSFRPPGGSWDPRVRDLAVQEGMRLVLWDVDPRDWSTKTSPKELTRAVLSRVRPGSIVLLHDGGGDAATTIAALPDIIRGIRKLGLRFTTV